MEGGTIALIQCNLIAIDKACIVYGYCLWRQRFIYRLDWFYKLTNLECKIVALWRAHTQSAPLWAVGSLGRCENLAQSDIDLATTLPPCTASAQFIRQIWDNKICVHLLHLPICQNDINAQASLLSARPLSATGAPPIYWHNLHDFIAQHKARIHARISLKAKITAYLDLKHHVGAWQDICALADLGRAYSLLKNPISTQLTLPIGTLQALSLLYDHQIIRKNDLVILQDAMRAIHGARTILHCHTDAPNVLTTVRASKHNIDMQALYAHCHKVQSCMAKLRLFYRANQSTPNLISTILR